MVSLPPRTPLPQLGVLDQEVQGAGGDVEADAVAGLWFGKSRMAYIRHLIRQDVNRRKRLGERYEAIDSLVDRLSPDVVETALRNAAK